MLSSEHVRLISVTPSSSGSLSRGVCSTARRPVPALTSCRNYRAHLQLSIQDVLATHGNGGCTVSAFLLLLLLFWGAEGGGGLFVVFVVVVLVGRVGVG